MNIKKLIRYRANPLTTNVLVKKSQRTNLQNKLNDFYLVLLINGLNIYLVYVTNRFKFKHFTFSMQSYYTYFACCTIITCYISIKSTFSYLDLIVTHIY